MKEKMYGDHDIKEREDKKITVGESLDADADVHFKLLGPH